jgi:hypothetical protein
MMDYYLVDGIYPPWVTFVNTISRPEGHKRSHFSTMQDSTRKYVEIAFSNREQYGNVKLRGERGD